MRTCVILNPNAGSADELAELERQIRGMGDVDIRRTQEPGDAERFAREALHGRFERIIAAGGDGTVSEVVNGLGDCFETDPGSASRQPCRVAFGILPLGTGNDFARSLDFPVDDPAAAIRILAAGHTRPVDVARLDADPPRYFLNTAGLGFTAKLSEQMSSSAKEWWGTLAYLLQGARTIPELEEHRMHLTLDDQPLDLPVYNIVIANGRFIGGGIPIAPTASIDDGKLDVVILPALPLTQLAVTVPKLLAGTADESDGLLRRQAARITVAADPPMPLNLDGEPAGQTPVTIITLPGALQMISP